VAEVCSAKIRRMMTARVRRFRGGPRRSAILARSYSAITPCIWISSPGLGVVVDGRRVGEDHWHAEAGPRSERAASGHR
jgi:hypothetical protein